MHLVMTGFVRFEGNSAVIRDATTFDVKYRHRNVEFDILLIPQVVFHVELESIFACQHLFGNRNDSERRHPFAQAKRIFAIVVFFLTFPVLHLEILKRVAIRDVILVATGDDLAILDENGLVAVFLHRIHGMSDKDDGLGRIFLDFGEEIVALALECLVTDGKHFVKHQNVALRLDGHGEGETHLHAGGIVLELLVHEVLKLGELYDVVIHRIDFSTSEAQQSTVQIHVLASGQLRVEAHTEFDERDQFALDGDRSVLRSINLRNDFQQRGLAGAVTPDDAEEIALMHLEIDIAQYVLFGIAFNALRPVQECHLQTGGLLGRQAEHLGHMIDLKHHRALVCVLLFSHCNLSHKSEHLRELGTVLAEHVNAEPQDDGGQYVRQQAQQLVIDHGPHGWHVFRGKQVVTDIHNHLRGRIQHEQFCRPGELRIIRHHGNRVDDRSRIEHGLQYDFPDMRHIAEIYKQGSEQQCHAKTEAIQLQNAEWHQQYAPSVVRVGEETEQDDHQQIDAERNHGSHSGGSDDDVVREMHLAQQITTSDDGLHAHAGRFREEAPQAGAAQQ